MAAAALVRPRGDGGVGRGGRRVGDPDRAGADPVGSGGARRIRTRRPRRGRAAARRAHGRRRRAARCGRPRCSTPPSCPTAPSCSGPSTCRRARAARRAAPADRPGEPDAGAGAARRRPGARGGAAPGHRRAQRAPRSAARSCANRPVAHRVRRTSDAGFSAEPAGGGHAAGVRVADPVGAHRRWAAVAVGASAAGRTRPPADDPVVISNYKADFTVDADGTLDAVETITGEFPCGRHGIFRYWDVANQNSPRVRQKPEITSILLDGEPVAVPDAVGGRRTVPGGQDRRSRQHADCGHPRLRDPLHHPRRARPRNHRREQAIRQHRRATPDSPSVFFWNVIAPSWNNEIQRARHLGRRCPPTSPARSVRSASASAAPARI